MMTAEPMITPGVHDTALVDTIDRRGATKLPAREREQLLEAEDVLLFGEPDSELAVWPANACDGRCWARTSDLRLVEAALSQLS
jgi:hypothetical protein